METNTEFNSVIPVLPFSNIESDIIWYKEKIGFEAFFSDNMYTLLQRDNLCISLPWQADTEDNSLLGGSVIRVFVKNIESHF